MFWTVTHAALVIHAESFELIQISSAKLSEIAFRVSLCVYSSQWEHSAIKR